jgi:hypothetical protein
LSRFAAAIAALALLALFTVALLPVHATAKPVPIIPLNEGTEWIYSAKVRLTKLNVGRMPSVAIKWQTRVVHKRDGDGARDQRLS